MKLTTLKYYVFFLMVSGQCVAHSQGNPGFLGKKIAVGYSTQYCLLKTIQVLNSEYGSNTGPKDAVSPRRLLTNHDFYLEYATSKFGSLTGHISYQKVPVSKDYAPDEWNEYVVQDYTLNGNSYTVEFNKTGGVSNYAMINIGMRYSLFNSLKTISSPVGFSYYFGLDMNINKALENNFTYEMNDNWSLTPDQKAMAEKGFIRSGNGSKSKNFSLCMGAETKMPLTGSVFFKLGCEMNLSTVGFKIIKDEFSSGLYTGVNEDLRVYGYNINRFRNLILIGMGIGVLL